jgi:hypothetical protein
MSTTLTRRQMLHLATLGAFGIALGACSTATTQPPATAVAQPAPASTAPLATATQAPPTAEPSATPANQPTASTEQTAAPTATTPVATLASSMAQAALGFRESLENERRAKASYAFADPERTRWHWTTPQGFPRNGLPLSEMAQEQRDLAFALLAASLTPAGLQKAQAIMALQTILGNDPLQYYITLFGEPGGSSAWSWRWEGHHYSRHFTVVGDTVIATPFFLGAWPTTTDAGLQAMPREEQAARELITALSGPLRDQAIFDTRTLTQHVTQNQAIVDPLEPVGVRYAELAAPQQALIDEIISTYLGTLPPTVAQPLNERIAQADKAQIQFGWAGPLEPQRPHYYRLQGPTFLLEFDNSRNGGTHIHSVWRDFAQDFGRHLL